MKIKVLTILTLAAALFLAACGKSDADLQKAAAAKLTAENIAGVNVAVSGGVATLTGEVADITVKPKAEAAVRAVEGIKSVDSAQLRIKPLPPPPAPVGDDKMLEGTVNENLKKAGLTGVTAAVSGGEVTLTGQVNSAADLAKAMQAASSTNPKKVNNNVTVKK